MTEFIDTKRREIQERIEFIEPLVAELPILQRALAALNGREHTPSKDEGALQVALAERDEARESAASLQRVAKAAASDLATAQARILELESGRKPEPKGGAKTTEAPNGGQGTDTSGAAPDTMLPPAPVTTTNGRKKPVDVSVEQARDWVCGQTEPFSTTDLARALDISPVTARRKLEALPDGMIRRPEGSPSTGGSARWEYVPVDPRSGPRRRPRGEDRGPREEAAPVPHTGRPKGPSDKPGAGLPGQLRRKKKGGQIMRIGGKK